MVVTYWCVRAQPLDMEDHGGVDSPGQEPDPRRGHVNSPWGSRNEVWVSPQICEACAWDTASFHSRGGSLEALKTGEKSVSASVAPDKCCLVQIASILGLQQS